jgi:5S rRNA maturation endonuclease (ribonuclease M5)
MFNLKQGTKFNVVYFAKKYGKFITRAGVWTEKSVERISKDNKNLFIYFDLDEEGYRTASGDIIINERKDN